VTLVIMPSASPTVLASEWLNYCVKYILLPKKIWTKDTFVETVIDVLKNIEKKYEYGALA